MVTSQKFGILFTHQIYIVFLARCNDKEQCLGTQAYIAILPVSRTMSTLRKLLLCLCFIFSYISSLSLSLTHTHTHTHTPYTQLLSYTYFRNSIKLFEYYTSWFLSEAGSLSIWLFISHYHLLLAKDGKGLLVLLPRFQYLNVLAVVTVYVFFFFVVHRAVRTLEKWLHESDTGKKPVPLADTSSNSVV